LSVAVSLFDNPEVEEILRGVEARKLLHEIGQPVEQVAEDADLQHLRVAAYAAIGSVLDGEGVRSVVEDDVELGSELNLKAFYLWKSLSDALPEKLDVDEALLLVAVGLLARRPVEVRAYLDREAVRQGLAQAVDAPAQVPWNVRCRHDISLALLLVTGQASHADIEMAGVVLKRLAREQREFEEPWLVTSDSRAALGVLGMYHLAHATILTSEFLLTGSAESNGRRVTDFAPELKRLLIRAEEYFELAGDPDDLLWLTAVAAVLWLARATSTWALARNISERIDSLLDELANQARGRPIFSLLPSQKDALRQNLLDPAKMAVVLQMPTSSGKTLLAEFAIAQAFEAYRGAARIAYVCPTRALATQVRRTLGEDLGRLGIKVSAAGGAFEDDPYEVNLLGSSDGVVVATPEKLDLLLRAHEEWASGLRLVVVDEAHLLKESERGVRLELLLATLRREQPQARLLLLTPFIENAREVARWLGGPDRGASIDVHWRPSRLILGWSKVAGAGRKRACTIKWSEPNRPDISHEDLVIPTRVPSAGLSTAKMIGLLRDELSDLGSILSVFTASRAEAESDAIAAATGRSPVGNTTPALRVAIATARQTYGAGSDLAKCLERGVAFHHSALSPFLRYLIEDQVRAGTIRYVAATTTLAQGMNFPVAVVLIHSVHKPYGQGDLSPAEFWNIAGRAGRVGMVEQGIVVFASRNHESKWRRYSDALSEQITSALLTALNSDSATTDLKELYSKQKSLRPFIQFLAHAAARHGPRRAMEDLDELVQASLANQQVNSRRDAARLRALARRYLLSIQQKNTGMLRAADNSGLGHFSFDELYAKISDSPLLSSGPAEVLRSGRSGLHELVEALRWLPELDLAIGYGKGPMNVGAVAEVVQRWINGDSIKEISALFPGQSEAEKVRLAGTYVFSKVANLIAWGAHAYSRGWSLQSRRSIDSLDPAVQVLPAYIQFGVPTPESVVCSLLGVPRGFAQAIGEIYVGRHGSLRPEDTSRLREFVEGAEVDIWSEAKSRSSFASDLDPADMRHVWRQMQGLPG
jgi:helicase